VVKDKKRLKNRVLKALKKKEKKRGFFIDFYTLS